MTTQAAPVVAQPVPAVMPKPRKPVEWTFITRGARRLMQVGVFSENKTEDLKWWISDVATKTEKKQRASSGGAKPEAAAENGAPAPEASEPAKPGALYLHVKEGENEEVYPLSAEDAKKYDAFSAKFDSDRGIRIIRAVRGSKTVGLPNKSKYWLSPRRTTEAVMPGDPKPGQNIAAYSLFQRKLETDNLVLVCHYVHGKGFSPVLIMASEDGLVMVQVPLLSRFHNVADAIDPAWKDVKTAPALREKFSEFFKTLMSDELNPADFEHPEHVHLRNLVVEKREAGEAKVDSGMYLEGGFDQALQAMIEEAGAPLVVEAPKKTKKAPAKKTGGSKTRAKAAVSK